MEKLPLTDLLTSEPIKLSYSSPSLLLFFSLKDILLIKELNKDISTTSLKPISIYIGDESKKVHLWKQKEPNCMDTFNGGPSIKPFQDYQITEVPWILIINNNQPLLSKKLSELERPLIKSLLHKYPEFKKQKENKKKDLEKIIRSTKLTTDEKISLLETLSNESQSEIQGLKRELDEKDKVLRGIMHKLDVFLGNKNRRKRRDLPSEEVKFESKSDLAVENVGKDEESEEIMPKDLWIYSISMNVKPQLPAIKGRVNQGGVRSKSTVLTGKINN